jgi:hypothetical protein
MIGSVVCYRPRAMHRSIPILAALVIALGGCASGRDGYAYLPPLVPPVYPQPQDPKPTRPPVQPVAQTAIQPGVPVSPVAGPSVGPIWPAPMMQAQPGGAPFGVMPGPAGMPPADCPL